jgi:hypothetical protein
MIRLRLATFVAPTIPASSVLCMRMTQSPAKSSRASALLDRLYQQAKDIGAMSSICVWEHVKLVARKGSRR